MDSLWSKPPEPPVVGGTSPEQRALTEEGLAGLTPEQRALLMLRLRRKGGTKEGGGLAPIPRAPRDGELPLSYAQQRLWFLDRWEPGNPAYDIPAAVRLRGELDVPAFAEAFSEIVRRHEPLRTTFTDEGGRPRQVIGAPWAVSLPVIDLAGLPGAARKVEARRIAVADARHVFDLSRGPLFKVTLVRLSPRGEAPGEHLALFNMHHIVSDGWSVEVLVAELVRGYRAFHEGRRPELPPLPIQYADFAVWQREWLTGEVLEAQLDWWRERLRELPPDLELPADRPRPAVRSSRGGRRPLATPARVRAALEIRARQWGATSFMVTLAGLEALLQRLTGQTDLSIGTPIANRNQAETEGLIGFFVNTLVLRTDLAGNPGFGELVERVREVTLGAFAHQDVPFEEVVRAVGAERDLSRTPLFQVMFSFRPATFGAGDMPGLAMAIEDFHGGTTKFDLEVYVLEERDRYGGQAEFSADLFDPPTIDRLFAQWRTLLEGALADPVLPLSELPLLDAGELQQLLREWNDTAPVLPPRTDGTCLHDLIEEQAARVPDAVAVAGHGEVVTYGELTRRARKLAGVLAGLGVGPEVRVGVCLGNTPERLVSVLGVLQAGGA